MASPEWSCSEISAALADNHVLFFGSVKFELGNSDNPPSEVAVLASLSSHQQCPLPQL